MSAAQARIRANEWLALDQARRGLVRRPAGWVMRNGDPAEIVHARTVAALAAKGFLVVSADGRTAQLFTTPSNGESRR